MSLPTRENLLNAIDANVRELSELKNFILNDPEKDYLGAYWYKKYWHILMKINKQSKERIVRGVIA